MTKRKMLAIVLLAFAMVIVVIALFPYEPEPEPVSNLSLLRQSLPCGYDIASHGWSKDYDSVSIRCTVWTGTAEEGIIFPDGTVGKIIAGTAVPVLSIEDNLMAMKEAGQNCYFIGLNESYESVLSRPILSTWVISISENTATEVFWYCYLRSGESATPLNGEEIHFSDEEINASTIILFPLFFSLFHN